MEDGLKYEQNDGGNYRDYTHNHVVRNYFLLRLMVTSWGSFRRIRK
ncbi:hypothetical protein SFC43_02470 [Bacteroides sp. CR5/BHMF/2]|nr:hypothetical protein [Bacteroides sp. CR5/BHMF/2]